MCPPFVGSAHVGVGDHCRRLGHGSGGGMPGGGRGRRWWQGWVLVAAAVAAAGVEACHSTTTTQEPNTAVGAACSFKPRITNIKYTSADGGA